MICKTLHRILRIEHHQTQ